MIRHISLLPAYLVLALLTVHPGARLKAQGGPPGARVVAIEQAQRLATRLYAATGTGFFRSDDSGRTWEPFNNGLLSQALTGLAETPGFLYTSTDGGGVHRSRDEGLTWEPVNEGLPVLNALSIAADPQAPSTLYVGTLDQGIFKTTNRGESWTAARDGIVAGPIVDIEVAPNDSNTVLAAQSNATGTFSGVLYRSVDGGGEWDNFPLDAVLDVEVDPSNPANVYVGTSFGIYVSRDGGAQFVGPIAPGTRFREIAVDPARSAVLFAASSGTLLISADGGANWFFVTGGLPEAEFLTLHIDREESMRVWAGADGSGVFVTEDTGTSWELASGGMLRGDARAVAVNPANSAEVLSAIQGGTVFRSANGGAEWSTATDGLAAQRIVSLTFDPTSPSRVYAGAAAALFTGSSTFFRSMDAGQSWEARIQGFEVLSSAVAPTTGRLYVGTLDGMLLSSDGAGTFEGASGRNGELLNLAVFEVVVDPTDQDRVFAIAQTQFGQAVWFVVRSSDGGRNWENAGGSAQQLRALIQDPSDRERLYTAGDGGVLISTDGGSVFMPSNEGFPDPGTLLVFDLAADAGDGSIYAGTSQGVFKSTDQGATWTLADRGLETTVVRQFAADPSNAGVLYAATTGEGVYKTIDGGGRWQPTGLGETLLPRLEPGGIVNAADFLGGGIAPGEIISLFGQRFGPDTGVSPPFGDDGKLLTSASGVQVLICGVPAPLFFVREDQINALVPNEVVGKTDADVQVVFNGVGSNVAQVPITATHPALFGAVLNSDGSVNSESNPEPVGGAVVLFGTGQGLTLPLPETGAPAPSMEPFARPELPVEVEFAGRILRPFFAGLAPGFVGLLQVNLPVPDDFGPGNLPARVIVGGTQAPRVINVYVGPRTAATE